MILLHGQLYSKSNSRQFIPGKKGGRPRIIKSAKAIKCKKDMVIQLKAQWGNKAPIPEPVHLRCKVYYQNRKSDLDISLLMDALQDAGVVENDRHIWSYHATKDIDRDNPHIEVDVMPMEEES